MNVHPGVSSWFVRCCSLALLGCAELASSGKAAPEHPRGGEMPRIATLNRDLPCVNPEAQSHPLRQLTVVELRNTLGELFRGATLPKALDSLDVGDALEPLSTAPLTVNRQSGALLAAASSVALDLERYSGCKTLAREDCVPEYIRRFGLHAFRRPLSAHEVARFHGFYQSRRAEKVAAEDALRSVVAAILLSPQFSYRFDATTDYDSVGWADLPADGVANYALASRLSYLLWQSMPDERLFTLAAKGQLRRKAVVEQEVRRMLADPRAADAFSVFVGSWFDLERVLVEPKSSTVFSFWTPESNRSALRESQRFAKLVFQSPQPTFSELLLSNRAVVDDRSAAIYGLQPSGTVRTVELDPKQRGGLLTRAAFLAGRSHDTASPPLRGSLVLRRLFCQSAVAPPMNVNTAATRASASAAPSTNRMRFERVIRDGRYCVGCHAQMDPLGYAFEHYDAAGGYVSKEMGLPVDAKVSLSYFGYDHGVDGAIELSRALATNPEVAYCVSAHLYGYAQARTLDQGEWCQVDRVYDAFTANGGNFHAALGAIALSDEFAGKLLP